MILINNEKELRTATKAVLSDLFLQEKINRLAFQPEKIINLFGEKRYRITYAFPIEKLIPIIKEEIETFNDSVDSEEKIIRNEQDLKSGLATILNVANPIKENKLFPEIIIEELEKNNFSFSYNFPIGELIPIIKDEIEKYKVNLVNHQFETETKFIQENLVGRSFLIENWEPKLHLVHIFDFNGVFFGESPNIIGSTIQIFHRNENDYYQGISSDIYISKKGYLDDWRKIYRKYNEKGKRICTINKEIHEISNEEFFKLFSFLENITSKVGEKFEEKIKIFYKY